MKMLVCLLLSISTSLSYAGFLPSGAKTSKVTNGIRIISLKNVTTTGKQFGTGTHEGYLKGKVTFQLIVDGNICGSDPSTFHYSKEYTEDYQQVYLQTIRKAESVNCTQEERPTSVTVTENFNMDIGDINSYAFKFEVDYGRSALVKFKIVNRKMVPVIER